MPGFLLFTLNAVSTLLPAYTRLNTCSSSLLSQRSPSLRPRDRVGAPASKAIWKPSPLPTPLCWAPQPLLHTPAVLLALTTVAHRQR